jgi:hypothetical protein
MHVLVVAKPKFQMAPEMVPDAFRGAMAWHDRYQERFIAFGTFPGGGGFGAIDVPDSETLNQMIAEMPFAPFSEHMILPYVPGVAGMQQTLRAFESMTARA